eukprot:CAMPEP_0176383430 /NCGR_PEP_ID=MMETSP0126-20121128/33500_1 /TAXON_ID=141414 ORGANISM="Strombidinopsis acuminatum, Strain SPMC142" /NCGR_SAMPLE_ID=MMETSP0126 /ASSEMBLY_ACC=CAM_ASM_000229 /LENGTH=47 /DNA_ID= /DNA_START= /DNA_END= /DNA_ORIENTATION=
MIRPKRDEDPTQGDPNNMKDREMIPDAESSLTDEIEAEENNEEEQRN